MKLFIRPKKNYLKKSTFKFDKKYKDSGNYYWQNVILKNNSNDNILPYISYETIERLRLKYGDIQGDLHSP